MPLSARSWTEPKQEDPPPSLHIRRPTKWIEPDREDEPPRTSRPFRI